MAHKDSKIAHLLKRTTYFTLIYPNSVFTTLIYKSQNYFELIEVELIDGSTLHQLLQKIKPCSE